MSKKPKYMFVLLLAIAVCITHLAFAFIPLFVESPNGNIGRYFILSVRIFFALAVLSLAPLRHYRYILATTIAYIFLILGSWQIGLISEREILDRQLIQIYHRTNYLSIHILFYIGTVLFTGFWLTCMYVLNFPMAMTDTNSSTKQNPQS